MRPQHTRRTGNSSTIVPKPSPAWHARALCGAMAVALLTAWLVQPIRPVAAQVGGGGTQVGISPEAGPPFPWEAGIQVTPYSVVNAFNGNLLTRIELVEPFDNVGVPFRLVLSHNSADSIGSLSPPQGALYPIGDGWNITYGGCLIDESSQNKMHLVEDDGLVKLFTWNGTAWVPPTGVYDKLEKDDAGTPSDPSDDQWIVTRKNQWKRVFNADGLLLEERDSNLQFDGLPTGGAVKLFERDPTLNYIDSISVVPPDYSYGFAWTFEYSAVTPPTCTDETSRIKIKVGKCCFGEGCPREWVHNLHLVLDANCRLKRVEWGDEPQSDGNNGTQPARVSLTYDSAGRIATITDKNGNTYAYEYDSAGRLYRATDPSPLTAQYQQLTYSTYPGSKYRTNYRDRRGNTWTHIFLNWGGLSELWNPSPLSAQRKYFAYDASYNRNSFTSEVGNVWSSTYDSSGNMLTMTNPLNQKWAFAYDSYNNLRTIDPPLDSAGNADTSKRVELVYDDQYQATDNPPTFLPADRTHVTAIIGPADGEGNPTATTVLAWNHGDGNGGLGSGPGRLDSVTDANGVVTSFNYRPGAARMSFDRHEGAVAPGHSDYRVVEDFTFACDGRGLWSTGHNAGGDTAHNVIAGGGCNTGISLAGMPSEHSCEDCPPSLQQCLTSQSDPPNPSDWPLASGSPACCDPVDRPTCFTELDDTCGTSCLDYMYRLLRQRWQKASAASTTAGAFDLSERVDEIQYDVLGRVTAHQVKSSLPIPLQFPPAFGQQIDRTLTPTPDANGNLVELVDAEGSETIYTYDAANRLTDIHVDNVHVVDYSPDAAGRPTLALYANGTSTSWTYDDAGRIDLISHNLGGSNLLTLDYNYTPDGLIDRIDQVQGGTSTVYALNYVYDKRGRLIREHGSHPPVPTAEGGSGVATVFDIAYTYDQLGNRLTKEDAIAGTLTTYNYDVHDATYDHTHNNRLLSSVMTQGSQTIEKVWYAYTRGGHVKRILKTTDPAADPTPYTLTCLDYDSNQHLWLVRGWEIEDGEEGVICETPTFAREFRYDGGGRRRYWSRDRDPVTLEAEDDSLGWREYLGDSIYAELTVNPTTGETDATRRYLHASDGRLIGWREGTNWHFVHADHHGSTRLVTMPNATVGSRLGYSAFGEVLTSGNLPGADSARSRYGYCGGWGYETEALTDPGSSIAATGLVHAGARYFVPELGRFAQRDPIGMDGGLNRYAYVHNNPNTFVDPSGHNQYADVKVAIAINSMLVSLNNAMAQGSAAVVAWGFNNGFRRPLLPKEAARVLDALDDAYAAVCYVFN